MNVIPAIDILGGRCVRLTKGDYKRETVYSDDPVKTAIRFREEGAGRLHIVDLEGARKGEPVCLEVAAKIAAETGLEVEYGGGIRSVQSVEGALKSGVDRVILGTVVVSRPEVLREAVERFGKRIWASVDVRSGKVAAEGWLASTVSSPIDTVIRLVKERVGGIVYTDIEKDGTLEGVNVDSVRAVLSFTAGVPVVYAGGVRDLTDIVKLRELEKPGIEGVIVGKALYEGTLSLGSALEAARGS